jgi:tetratricopeptide (TPR) repeat protein
MNDVMKTLLLSEYMLILVLIILFFITGYARYLDAVPDKHSTVLNSVDDYEALLDSEVMFTAISAMSEFGADDIYFPDVLWASQQSFVRDAYRWMKDADQGNFSPDWNYSYVKIHNTNIVLHGIDRLRNNRTSANIDVLKGRALFCRAKAFFDLQEVFGLPYRPGSADTDLGIPLKLSITPGEKVGRATVAATFARIVEDLEQAIQLLPAEVSKVDKSKPGKAAAYALLSRVYLVMQDYNQAKENAWQSLKLYNVLVDYNSLLINVEVPIINGETPFNPLLDEVIYSEVRVNHTDRNWRVTQDLYNAFSANDLRKIFLFTPDPVAQTGIFKGFYNNAPVAFDRLATDEMYLVMAECKARTGNEAGALEDLNTLLLKRYETGTYTPYAINSGIDVLTLVLSERRKECIFRNLRWSDLRRLNQDPRFAKILTRTVNGRCYELPANDPRYTLPIPGNDMRINGIVRN